MEAKQMIPIRTYTDAAALIGTTPLAAQGNCKPVDDAMNKVFTTHLAFMAP